MFSQPPGLWVGMAGAADRAEEAHFERHVRPVLVKHCVACHGREMQEGELESLESILNEREFQVVEDVAQNVNLQEELIPKILVKLLKLSIVPNFEK